MKLPPFEYRAADTAEEALSILGEFGDEAKVMAGGQSLIPLMAIRMSRPAVIVDINRVDELASIASGDVLELGAMVRHRGAEKSELVQGCAPMLTAAIGYVGHVAIRTRGTLGGSVAHADPAAELPAVLTALSGSVVARSARGSRTIDADSFFLGFLTTALEPDELLTSIQIPKRAARSGWAFNEFSRRNGDFALVGAAVALDLDDQGSIAGARIVLSGIGTEPVRAIDAEATILGARPDAQMFAEAAAAAAREVDPSSDLHGSGAYRKHVAGVLVERGLGEALHRAKESQ